MTRLQDIITEINRSQNIPLSNKRTLREVSKLQDAAVSLNEAFVLANLGTNQLISGGATWVSGLTFLVSDCVFVIDGVLYTSEETTLTLSAADVTNPRIDVLAVNISGVAEVVTGTAAASPVKPEVNPDTQVEVTFVTVANGATTPSAVTNEDVYLEDAEWTSAVSANVNAADTSDPRTSSKAIKFTAPASRNYITLTTGVAQDANTGTLGFWMKPLTWPNAKNAFRIALYNTTTRVSDWFYVTKNSLNVASAEYQFIQIPLSSFNAYTTSFKTIRIEAILKGSVGSTVLIDDIKLQAGLDATDLAGITAILASLGTAAYEDIGYFALFAQGATADTAYQPGDTFLIPQTTSANAVAADAIATVTGTPAVWVPNVNASGTVTITGTPVADQNLIVNDHTYLFKATRSGVDEITIDANNTTQAENIVAAITADGAATVTAVNALGVVTVTAVGAGSTGDAYALSTTGTGVAVSDTTFTDGTDEIIEVLVVGSDTFTFVTTRSGAASFEITVDANNTTQAGHIVTAVAADSATCTATNSLGVVTITALTKGTAGNAFAISTDANGVTISGDTGGFLDGGVAGTVGAQGQLVADTSYVYYCTQANAATDNFWRRIDTGPADYTNFAQLASSNVYTAAQGSAITALTDAATISWDMGVGNVFSVVLDGARTMAAPTNHVAGYTYILFVVQDDTVGGRTITWNSDFHWAGGTAPTLATAVDSVDVITFISDGAFLHGSLGIADSQ